MLPKTSRLKKTDFILFKKKLKDKKTFNSEHLTLTVVYTVFTPSRFAVVVPASVLKKSTERNKIKRRARSIILKNLDKFKNKLALMIRFKLAGNISFDDLEKELVGLFKKSGVLK